jgi:hypothetical protein
MTRMPEIIIESTTIVRAERLNDDCHIDKESKRCSFKNEQLIK